MLSKSQSKFSQDHGSRAERRREAKAKREAQRRLDKLVADDEAAGVGSIDDRAFFEAHPEREYRMRLATQNEIGTIAEICGSTNDDDDPRFYWMVIRQFSPGVRARVSVKAALPPPGCAVDDVPEIIARDTFLEIMQRGREVAPGVTMADVCDELRELKQS